MSSADRAPVILMLSKFDAIAIYTLAKIVGEPQAKICVHRVFSIKYEIIRDEINGRNEMLDYIRTVCRYESITNITYQSSIRIEMANKLMCR